MADDPHDAMPQWLADKIAANKDLKRVFVVKGLAPIRQSAATIKADGKVGWAILPTGRRHLLGATAFFTRASAERSKLGILRKTLANAPMGYAPSYSNWANAADNARRQLLQYEATGRLH